MALSDPSDGFNFRITAIDAASATMSKVLSKAGEFAQKLKGAMSTGGKPGDPGGLAGGLKGLGQTFEPVEKLGKVFTSIQATAIAFQGVSAAIKGNWDEVGQSLQQLPFGIGQLSKFAQDFKAEITGAKKELEALGETATRIDRETAMAQKRNEHFRKTHDQMKGAVRDIDRANVLGGLGSESAKIQQQIRYDIDDVNERLKEALKEHEKLGGSAGTRMAAMLRAQADALKRGILGKGVRDVMAADAEAAAERMERSLQRWRGLAAPIGQDFMRLGSAIGRMFDGVRTAAEGAANVMAERFKAATDRVRAATDAVGDAQRRFRGVEADRGRRQFEIDLAAVGNDPFAQARVTVQRAEALRREAKAPLTDREDAAARLDEAIDLITDQLKGALGGQAPGDVNQLRFMLRQLEGDRGALAMNERLQAGRKLVDAQAQAAILEKEARHEQFRRAATTMNEGATAVKQALIDGGRMLKSIIMTARPQAGGDPWRPPGGGIGPMAAIEQMNRLLQAQIGR